MLIVIDHSDPAPLYRQIVRQVTDQVTTGQLSPGDRLPPAGELASSLDLNRNTVLQAYRALRDDGVIELRRGRGAVVLDPAPGPDLVDAAVTDLVLAARRTGASLSQITRMLTEKGLS
ncbi:GntR family transcriptional regulator [Corynebacterium neomassiliense]|uniref:GntR family transcriptional regulator n=1 Tax=Corynebacterium neomassiliense TaxID=2079482 RepID=UPI00102FBB16|nr:GntR family transcriptional regulator [Corynebacterium neomassiliense]